MSTKAVSVLGVAGDSQLGGSDFDDRMRSVLERKFQASPTSKPLADSTSRLTKCDSGGLLQLGEQAKIQLSHDAVVEVQCLEGDANVHTLSVAREEFELASQSIFERCIAPVEKVLSDQMMTTDDVDDIVLVGGAARMPKLRSLLQEFMGEKKLHIDKSKDIGYDCTLLPFSPLSLIIES